VSASKFAKAEFALIEADTPLVDDSLRAFGHRTSEMAERYARQARQRRLADGAVGLMEGTGTDDKNGTPPTSVGNCPALKRIGHCFSGRSGGIRTPDPLLPNLGVLL